MRKKTKLLLISCKIISFLLEYIGNEVLQMRETYKMRRWISLCLIIILTVSGMCFERVKTDPDFGVSVSASSDILRTLQVQNAEQDMCSPDQLGDSMLRGSTEVLRLTVSGQKNRIFSRIRSLIRLTATLCGLPDTVFFREASITASSIITYGSVIITYIHQQDGSKG